MTSMLFKDLYDRPEGESAEEIAKQVVPAGIYDVVVDRAQPYTSGKAPMVFLTLTITSGPLAGKKSDVNITFTDSPQAQVYFRRKTRGLYAYPDTREAAKAADAEPDADAALAVIANSWLGKALRADIGVAKGGKYDGTNELKSTEYPGSGSSGSLPQDAVKPQVVATPTSVPFNDGQVSVPF